MSEVGHNHEANNELKDLELGGLFNNPKPTRLIRRMCVLSDTEDRNGIVLDFFAGSATTADAVFRQNADDEVAADPLWSNYRARVNKNMKSLQGRKFSL